MLIDSSTPKINPPVQAPKRVLKHKEQNKWINPPAIICTLTGASLGVLYYWKKYNIKMVKLNDQYVFIKHIPQEEIIGSVPLPEGKSNVKLVLFMLFLCVAGFYGVKKFNKKPVPHIDMKDFQFLKDQKKEIPTPVTEPTPPIAEQPDAAKPSQSVPAGVRNSFEGDPPEEVEHGVLVS